MKEIIDPATWGESPRGLVQNLLELGEDSLDSSTTSDDECLELHSNLTGVICREFCTREDFVESRKLVSKLQSEALVLVEERNRAYEQVEDVAQEMAELKYNLMEMLQHERETRARVELSYVQRVQQLEAQAKKAIGDTLISQSRAAEAERQLELHIRKTSHLRVDLEGSRMQLQQLRAESALLAQEKTQSEEKLAVHLKELKALQERVQQLSLESDQLSLKNEILVNSLNDAYTTISKLEAALKEKDVKFMGLLGQFSAALDDQGLAVTATQEPCHIFGTNAHPEPQLDSNTSRGSDLEMEFLEKLSVDSTPGEISDCQNTDKVVSLEIKNLKNVDELSDQSIEVEGERQTVFFPPSQVSELSDECVEVLGLEYRVVCLPQSEVELSDECTEVLEPGCNVVYLTQSLGKEDCDLVEKTSATPMADLVDKHIYSNEVPWSVHSVTELVESITDELTKILRVLNKTSSAKQSPVLALETQIKSWSNVTRKGLESKVLANGALEAWGKVVVDLMGKSRQELVNQFHRLQDWETESTLVGKLHAEQITLIEKTEFLKDEIGKWKGHCAIDKVSKEGQFHSMKKKLVQTHLLIAETEKTAQQQHALGSLRFQIRRLELEYEKSKLKWAEEKHSLENCVRDRRTSSEREDELKKVIENLETRMEGLVQRLDENEKELGVLMDISGIDLDAVVVAKLKRMEQKLEDATSSEMLAAAEKAEVSAQMLFLTNKLEEVELQLSMETQKHVEALIQSGEELEQVDRQCKVAVTSLTECTAEAKQLLMELTLQLEAAVAVQGSAEAKQKGMTLKHLEASLESVQAELKLEKSYHSVAQKKIQELSSSLSNALQKSSVNSMDLDALRRELQWFQNTVKVTQSKLAVKVEESHVMEQTIKELEVILTGQDKLLSDKKEISVLTSANEKMMDEIESLKMEISCLQKQLTGLRATQAALEDSVLVEKQKLVVAGEEKLKQEMDRYANLELEFMNLQLNYIALQAEINELEEREKGLQVHISKLDLQLGIAKDEIFRYEVRLQKNMKQAKEEVDMERRKLDDALTKQKQAEWFLSRQLEQTEVLDREKHELLQIIGQMQIQIVTCQNEQDDLRVAYAELAKHTSRKGAV